jgi:TonB family protein
MCYADIQKGRAAFESKKYDLAYKELRPIADSGNAKAQYLIGQLYHHGNGVEKNEKEAVAWYFKAARGGYDEAQFALSDMYQAGKGAEKDESLASYWQWRAAYSLMKQTTWNLAAEYEKEIATPTRTAAVKKQCSKPDYPEEARAANQQGKVALFFIVGKDGNVIDLGVMQSSGWPILDQASLKSFKSCTFDPATVDGIPVESVFAMSYTWKLRRP